MLISRLAVATALMTYATTPAHAEETADSEGETILVVGQRDAPIELAPRGLSV